MKRFRFLARLVLLGFVGTAFAAPFQNGSFETGTPTADPCNTPLPIGSTAITGWTVIAGNIDYITTCWSSSQGARSLDLVGTGNIGGVQQTFDTVPGATYQVSFDLAGNPGPKFQPPFVKPLTVTVAGITNAYGFDTTGKTGANMGWTTQTFSFVAAGPTATIAFVSDLAPLGSAFAGAALDNVSIVRTFASTSTGLFSSLNPSPFGSAVTFTVQVLGTVGWPTGTIDFTVDGSPNCTAVPLGPTGSPLIATASCIVPLLAIGSHTIGATYSGNVLNAGSSNTLTQVVNAVVIGAPVWSGSAGNVVNAGQGNLPIASSPTVVNDGTAGPAIFTYQTVNSPCCHTGDWAFHTTATAPAPAVTLNWTYSGYHGTCRAQATLTAFVIRAASSDFSATQYDVSDAFCSGALPSGGFGQHGQVVLPGVLPGDVYGFEMFATNFDSNGGVGGRLTVTTGTLATTTTLFPSANPAVSGASVDFTATVMGTAPTGTVLFTRQGRPLPGCDAVPLAGGFAVCSTNFLFVGNNNIVASYTGDTVNAGSVSDTLVEIINPLPPSVPLVVNSTADSVDASPGDGSCADAFGRCTLRAAIIEANALSGAQTITVPAGTYTLAISGAGEDAGATGDLNVAGDLTIVGAGAASTIVDGGAIDRVFKVNSGVVTISGLTVRNGSTVLQPGGGIENNGSLTLYQAVVSGNATTSGAGGIFNQGTLILNSSTVSGNVGGAGAGIYSFYGALTLINSTVSGNHSIGVEFCGFGGGGMLIYGGQATITSSTLFANIAECLPGFGGRGHAISSQGGATVTIRNSIAASPALGSQVCYGPVASLGRNIVHDSTCGAVASDLISDPMLAALADNGGPTPTHAPFVGSPAVNAVPVAECIAAADQRGVTRPQGPACDIGAVEGSVPVIQPPTLGAPTLVRVIATSSNDAYVIGRADGLLGTSVTFNAYSAQSCNAGALVGGSSSGPFTTTTDAAGYFAAAIPNVTSGHFVAVQLTAPSASAMSACTVSSGDNDFWPRALEVVNASPLGDYIDAAGKARWYKFSVTPGQKAQVTLSGLPADYDLVVFKDIGQLFISQLSELSGDPTAALTRLSAEFAPSTFSPSTFSPSTFSPSTFSADEYSPSTFSPSTFSPSTFSPSTFSPSTFSPSTFSPSTFSPSTFSPSTFSPSTFSPSTFSPASVLGLNQDDVAKAFSSAQTRGIIGVSATPGNGNESVVVNTWNNTGHFYARVSARGAAFSTNTPFTLNVTRSLTNCVNVGTPPSLPARQAVAGSSREAIILTDSTRVTGDSALLVAKLTALAGGVAGVVVDLKDDERVLAYRDQARIRANCPYAKNLLAQEIKSIVDAYRAANLSTMRYVVIAGNDDVVPFFRYPDESLLGQESDYVPPVASTTASEASLRQDYVLSQDAYGSSTSISMRAIEFPIPGLAVGRLVETAAEIGGMIDAYLGQTVVVPKSSLVTGYDFLQDAADAVRAELVQGIGTTTHRMDTLITPNDRSPQHQDSWTAAQLSTQLLSGGRHDVIFLAGHFSANSALAADFSTSLVTTDLTASTKDFTNSIVFSAGCHAGYNIVDTDAIDGVTLKLDWPQAFAQKKATLIAGTGYQYGDTDFLEYSERLYRNFARQLRAGQAGTVVSVGEALVKAKIDYLASTPDVRGLHQKALLEATVFGLPMLGVNMAAGRDPLVADPVAITPQVVPPGPAATLGLQFAPLSLTFSPSSLLASHLCLRNPPHDTVLGPPPADCPPPNLLYTKAEWLTGPDGVTSNPAEPALPLQIVNVTPAGNVVLRGVGFLGGNYTDSTIVPLTGAPTIELRGVHTPFLSPVFFPMRLSTPNYYGALSGTGGTKLLVTPAQHRAASVALGTSTLRQYSGLNLRLYYSGNATSTALSAAPTIVSVADVSNAGVVTFAAHVVGDPAAAIHEVWVTHTGGTGTSGTWASLPLTQCAVVPPATTPPTVCGATADSQKWMGELSSPPANLKYIVQAVNGIGLVSTDDNLGAYYSLGAGFSGGGPVGTTGPVATTLALISPPSQATYGDSMPIAVSLNANGTPIPAGKLVTVSVGGSSQAGVTDDNGNATVSVPISSLPGLGIYQLKASFSGDQDFLPSSVSVGGFSIHKAASNLAPLLPLGARLTGASGLNSPPIAGSVRFTLTSSTRPTMNVWAITDYLGRATLPPPGLAAGEYTVTVATFDGNSTYNATTTTPGQLITIPKANQTIAFGPLSNKTFGDPDFTVTATSTSLLPVSFSPSGPCTVSGNTVHITGAGTCTITAASDSSLDFHAAPGVPQAFIIAPASSTTSLSASPMSAVFGQPVTLAATVTSTPTGAGIPAGTTVTFKDGGTVLGAPEAVAGGTASRTTSSLAIGSHVMSATYDGNANVGPSTGFVNVEVGKLPTTTAITADKTSPVPYGTTINLTATMAPATATGPVTFLDGATTLGTATAVVADATTTRATFATSTLGIGTHSLTAGYAGNATNASSTSAPLSLAIKESFTTTNSMLQARVSHTATLLHDGRVLVAGGSGIGDDDRRASRTAEIYCPNPYTPPASPVRTLAEWCPNGLGKFSPAGRGNSPQVGVGNLVKSRTYHTATLLPNGTVLLVGGYDGSGVTTATAELYDPTDPIADKFTAVPNLPANAAAGHTATLVTKNGKAFVLVIGGLSWSSQLYDTTTKTWSRTGSMSTTRTGHTASLVGSQVFVAGGTDLLGRTLQTTTNYDIGNGTFSNGPTMLAPREWHSASAIANGKVLLAGGRASTGIVTNTVALSPLAEIYDPNNTATPFAASTFASGTGRFGHSASALIGANEQPDGRVFVVGGGINVLCGQQLATSEVYGSGGFTASSTLAAARVRHTATVLEDGRVLVTGGRGTIGSRCGPLNTAEIWNGPSP